MKWLPTSSILRLTLVAFAVVTLPLAIGLITVTVSVGQLGAQGEHAVRTAADTVRYSRLMVSELTNMERSVRQFRVLGDPSIYKAYLKQREAFRKTSVQFEQLDLNPAIRHKLAELLAGEASIFHQFNPQTPDSKASKKALTQFANLYQMARNIMNAGTRAISSEIDNMQAATDQLRRRLWLLVITLIPLVLLAAGLAALAINRPIRHLSMAIRRLGGGDFEHPVLIRGPRDLVGLGERLEWLRIKLNDLEQHRVRFLQHISHELKTPLTAIREGTQLLTDEITGPLNAEQKEIGDILQMSGRQLQKRIEDLLNFSSLETDGDNMQQPVSIDETVKTVVKEQHVAIKTRKLTVTPDIEPASIFGNPEHIRLIVENLLTNAVKYSPEGGTIRFCLRQCDKQVILDVYDQGPGIAPSEREKVFEAFYQGQPPPNAGHVKGTGLGLAITHEYLTVCRGTIEIMDATVGAHFRITLPAYGQ